MEDNDIRLTELTTDIVSAYVRNNPVPAAQLPDLIASVDAAMRKLQGPVAKPLQELVPTVNPKKSIFPDHIICLEDGRRFKSLKRHLRTDFGLSPEEYRSRWGLPADYPMVAPNYSQKRSALAKASGLGQTTHRRVTAPTGHRHAVQ
jgi:predicted transcriptional regulator